MIVIQDFAAFAGLGLAGPTAVTIGNFDGCHLGHLGLLQAVVGQAAALAGPAVAVTFLPRPDAFFRQNGPETLLFTEEQKSRALAEAGVQVQVLKTFDASFSQMTHATFYESCLAGDLRAKAIVVGDNFRFGRDRAGDTEYLAKRGEVDGILIQVGSAASHAGQRISSTRVRQALEAGSIADVTAMLGRPYLIEGRIERGDQLGRQLGVPTANLEGVAQLLPRYGIYAGYVWLGDPEGRRPTILTRDKDAIPAVFSIGVRPALRSDAPPLRIEAHLLSGSYGANALYGMQAGYYITHRLRDERPFADLEALKRQMAADIAEAKQLVC